MEVLPTPGGPTRQRILPAPNHSPRFTFRSLLVTRSFQVSDLDDGEFQRLARSVALRNTLHRSRLDTRLDHSQTPTEFSIDTVMGRWILPRTSPTSLPTATCSGFQRISTNFKRISTVLGGGREKGRRLCCQFEDALLDVVHAVVRVVERGLGLLHVEPLEGVFACVFRNSNRKR